MAILNSGLSNEINIEAVIEEVLKYAQLEDLAMLPNKSYCFLIFSEEIQAALALNSMNAIAKLGQNGSPLIMSFCEKIPSTTDRLWSTDRPNGLYILENCVTSELEQALMENLIWNDTGEEADGKLKYRKVQHFGYEFKYGLNSVDPDSPLIDRKIPEACDAIWSTLNSEFPTFQSFKPEQLTVNRYEPGNGIPSHCDTHSCFEDPIVSLSLGSSIVMEFKQPDTSKHVSVFVPRRSLLIMSGESRLAWTHGITPRKSDVVVKPDGKLSLTRRDLRVSFTFRKLKIPPGCSCSYKSLCDVVTKSETSTTPEMEVTNHLAAKLEIENVHKVYNLIGTHFSETRHSPWPNVENFIVNLQGGAILLDVGCGNGKYLGINDSVLKFGCDRSDTLLQVCLQRRFNVFQCDCLELPIRDATVDACISIAVIHHLATHQRRLQAIEQMARVLVKGGTALIYVWAKDQQKENKKSTYLLQHQKKDVDQELIETATFTIDEKEIQLPVHRNRTQFNHTNVLVPWKLKQKEIPQDEQKVFLRYYHVFEDGELEKLCQEVSSVEIIKSYYDQGNHCVIIKKI